MFLRYGYSILRITEWYSMIIVSRKETGGTVMFLVIRMPYSREKVVP